MAKLTCVNCNKLTHNRTGFCIHCNEPIPRRNPVNLRALLLIIAFGVPIIWAGIILTQVNSMHSNSSSEKQARIKQIFEENESMRRSKTLNVSMPQEEINDLLTLPKSGQFKLMAFFLKEKGIDCQVINLINVEISNNKVYRVLCKNTRDVINVKPW